LPARSTDTAQRITSEALVLFAEQGYDRTTMAGIAARVGVTEPALYRHFKDKKQLFISCVLAAIDGSTSALVGHLSRETTLRGYVRAWLKLRLEMMDKYKPLFDLLFTESIRHPELAHAYADRFVAEWQRDSSVVLEELRARGAVHIPSVRILGIGLLSAIWALISFGPHVIPAATGLGFGSIGDELEDLTEFVLLGIAGHDRDSESA